MDLSLYLLSVFVFLFDLKTLLNTHVSEDNIIHKLQRPIRWMHVISITQNYSYSLRTVTIMLLHCTSGDIGTTVSRSREESIPLPFLMLIESAMRWLVLKYPHYKGERTDILCFEPNPSRFVKLVVSEYGVFPNYLTLVRPLLPRSREELYC